MQINLHESDISLSELVKRALAGEEVIIDGTEGKPVAKLIPYETPKKTRRLGGSWEGRVWMADDFDEIPQEIAEAFGIKDR